MNRVMDSARFSTLTRQSLEALAEAAEAQDKDGNLDVELHDGVLTITFESGPVFVINRHEPSGKIWVSSPFSGAHYFTYSDAECDWVEGTFRLQALILEELAKHADA